MLEIERRSVLELEFETKREYKNPFLDVVLDGEFTSPSGAKYKIPGFYDDECTWKVRFSPNETGVWSYRTITNNRDSSLEQTGRFRVVEPDKPIRGFLKTCPGKYWGLEYESGEPCFIFGDTMYNLFGAAYCGLDVETVLKRRSEQGFNLIRVRLQVSPYHPPRGYNDWQTRSAWPWGGSPQKPDFIRFNLDYFRTVDRVMNLAQDLGIGFEMIMEGWGFEYPFNRRDDFLPEYEELWIQYLVARYDAFSSVYIWTLMNEYEYYPDGDWRYNLVADLWAIRVGRYIKRIAPHDHPIAVHNGPRQPPFAERFRIAPGVIDLIMFQTWGTRGKDDAWLAAGIEEDIAASMKGWEGAFILAEYGYERNPELELRIPLHEYTGPEHTRRGAWRGVFSAAGIIHGWENTWGPWWIPEKDQEGMKYLLILKKFFTEVVEFHRFQPVTGIIDKPEQYEYGKKPLCMASRDKDAFLVYLPVGERFTIRVSKPEGFRSFWFNPRTGEIVEAAGTVQRGSISFDTPDSEDWVLVMEKH